MIVFLILFLAGFFLGRWTLSKDDVKILKKFIKPHIRPGIIRRPTAEQIRKRGTKEAEGEKEMSKTFNRILRKK